MSTKTEQKKRSYTSADIETQRFPDSIRKSPGMYIGGTDDYARWIVAKEPLDNALDEALAGSNSMVWLDVSGPQVTVIDEGHGIPQGIKKYTIKVGKEEVKVRMPVMQAIFGELHTSGKFRDSAYARSVGTHGVGAKATNATAKTFRVWTFFENKWYRIGFKKGELTEPVTESKAPIAPDGKKLKKGTMVQFEHDPTIFTGGKRAEGFPLHYAVSWGEVMAYLTPGFTVKISKAGKLLHEFVSKNGPKDYVADRLKKLKVEAEKQLLTFHNGVADVIVSFSTYGECGLQGFTNGSLNSQGGKHVDSVTSAYYKALLKAGDVKIEKAKKKGERAKAPFTEVDAKEGLVGLVNAKLHKPQFNSQDKVKLSDDRMGAEFAEELYKEFLSFLKENKALTKRLVERATALGALRSKFTLDKNAAKELNKLRSKGMPSKYSPAMPGTKPEHRELLLVEGDSAGGGIRKTKKPYQALLPLKGKILNSLKDPNRKALQSHEVLYILGAIGYDPKASDPLAKLQVGKIICVADPDPDGPFVGDTKIRIRTLDDGDLGNEPHETSIEKLVGRKFEVPVHLGGSEHWREATARHVADVDTLVALEIGNYKYKVSASHLFVVVRTPAVRDRIANQGELEVKGYPNMGDTLAFIRAGNLRVGDRIWAPSNEGGRKVDYNKQDKATGRGFLAVNKMRVQRQLVPVPVYCLDVPEHHHFVLPSGAVSGNCHINTLLLSLFYKYLPELFDRGMVYVAETPEFYAIHGENFYFGNSLASVRKEMKDGKVPSHVEVKHIKGWGEVDAPVLEHLLLNPETRDLIKIKPIRDKDHTDFVRLMNEDVAYRRDLLGLPMSNAKKEREAEKATKAREKEEAKAKKAKAEKKGKKATKVESNDQDETFLKARRKWLKKNVSEDKKTWKEKDYRKAARVLAKKGIVPATKKLAAPKD